MLAAGVAGEVERGRLEGGSCTGPEGWRAATGGPVQRGPRSCRAGVGPGGAEGSSEVRWSPGEVGGGRGLASRASGFSLPRLGGF